ncbi:HotDog domain-containing protein [Zopfochytrium polystomum]|nr:HotDog domain-containing protein [Zopfochytrium polystomum]
MDSGRNQETGWDPTIFRASKFVEALPDGRFVWELEVTEEMLNGAGTIHGGCLSTIIDLISSLSKLLIDAANDRPLRGGVSLNLSTTFISAAVVGDVLVIEVTVPKIAKKVFFTDTKVFKRGKDGKKGPLVAEGSHTKFMNEPEASKL